MYSSAFPLAGRLLRMKSKYLIYVVCLGCCKILRMNQQKRSSGGDLYPSDRYKPLRHLTKTDSQSEIRVNLLQHYSLKYPEPATCQSHLAPVSVQFSSSNISLNFCLLRRICSKALDHSGVTAVPRQIKRNTAGEVEIAAMHKGIWDRFGQHSGQYTQVALQALKLKV